MAGLEDAENLAYAGIQSRDCQVPSKSVYGGTDKNVDKPKSGQWRVPNKVRTLPLRIQAALLKPISLAHILVTVLTELPRFLSFTSLATIRFSSNLHHRQPKCR
jgi:hypothetical protein